MNIIKNRIASSVKEPIVRGLSTTLSRHEFICGLLPTMREFTKLLNQATSRVVLLTGDSACGKTTLASSIAYIYPNAGYYDMFLESSLEMPVFNSFILIDHLFVKHDSLERKQGHIKQIRTLFDTNAALIVLVFQMNEGVPEHPLLRSACRITMTRKSDGAINLKLGSGA